jgi:hypothetical protein
VIRPCAGQLQRQARRWTNGLPCPLRVHGVDGTRAGADHDGHATEDPQVRRGSARTCGPGCSGPPLSSMPVEYLTPRSKTARSRSWPCWPTAATCSPRPLLTLVRVLINLRRLVQQGS